jgi:hypothetical protein
VQDATQQGFIRFAVAVPDLDRMARSLTDASLEFEASPDRLTIGTEEAFGVAIDFVTAKRP